MVVLSLGIIAVIIASLCIIDVLFLSSCISKSALVVYIDGIICNLNKEWISSLTNILIPQLWALLAICVTVFVFLFTELNAWAQRHPSESTVCSKLQESFALQIGQLSALSIVLVLLSLFLYPIYCLSLQGVAVGHFLFAIVLLTSFILSLMLVFYCVDAALYKYYLRALLSRRKEVRLRELYTSYRMLWLKEIYTSCKALWCNNPTHAKTAAFILEYSRTSQLVCEIAGSQDHANMTIGSILQFSETLHHSAQSKETASEIDKLEKALLGLYRYQAVIVALDDYMDTNETTKQDFFATKYYTYIAKFFTLPNSRLPVSVYRRVDIPRTESTAFPSAARIAQGIRNRIVTGNQYLSPLDSQRFNNFNFSTLDFSYGDLCNTIMNSCRLVGSDFSNANLRQAHFSNCDLRDSLFKKIHCENLTFDNCALDGITIRLSSKHESSIETECVFSPASPSELTTVSFKNSSMTHVRIGSSETAMRIDLSNVSFSETNLQHASFHNASLDYCSFIGALMDYTLFCNCTGTAVDLSDTQILGKTSVPTFLRCTFNRCSFISSITSNMLIMTCIFEFLNATRASSKELCSIRASFAYSNFTDASFLYASLSATSFDNCDLTDTRILDSSITDCSFALSTGKRFHTVDSRVKQTRIYHAHFEQADLSRSFFTKCEFIASSLPSVICHNSDFQGTVFQGILLEGADFTDSTFEGGSITQTILTNTLFDRTTFTKVEFFETDFKAVRFRHTKFTNCTLRNCTWSREGIVGASFSQCRFFTTSEEDHHSLCALLMQAEALFRCYVDEVRLEGHRG